MTRRDTKLDEVHDIKYDIMTSTLMRSITTLGSAGSCSCLAASLSSPCCPNPVLADTLAPDPLSLGYGQFPGPGAAPAIAPHPDVHLVQPTAVAPVPLRVGGGASKTPIVLEAVWNR